MNNGRVSLLVRTQLDRMTISCSIFILFSWITGEISMSPMNSIIEFNDSMWFVLFLVSEMSKDVFVQIFFLWIELNCASADVLLQPWGDLLTVHSSSDLSVTSEIHWLCLEPSIFEIEWILLRCSSSSSCSEKISLSSSDRETFFLSSGSVTDGRYQLIFSLRIDGIAQRKNLSSLIIQISSTNSFLNSLHSKFPSSSSIFTSNEEDLHMDLLDRPVRIALLSFLVSSSI